MKLWYGKSVYTDKDWECVPNWLEDIRPRWHYNGYTLATAIQAGDYRVEQILKDSGWIHFDTTTRIDPRDTHLRYRSVFRD